MRRTFLCGMDKETGKDFSHRKRWIVDRMKYLSQIFAMDIAAFAVMSNHYHLVLHVNRSLAKTWSDEEVFKRYKRLHPKKAEEMEALIDLNPNHPLVTEALEVWRARLLDISWFMKCMNEPIARQCNVEDDCTGHFWQGRFKSQALLDEGAVLSAMAYVDLNPIRAGICNALEDSDYTSIQERLAAYRKSQRSMTGNTNPQPSALMFFNHNKNKAKDRVCLPFNLEDYFKLVDESGREIRSDKQGYIPKRIAPIMGRLGLNPTVWLNITKHLESLYAHVIGCEEKLMNFSKGIGAPKGVTCSRVLYAD